MQISVYLVQACVMPGDVIDVIGVIVAGVSMYICNKG